MPDLLQSLEGQDLGYLRIVAELWGLDLRLDDGEAAAQVAAGMLHPGLAGEIRDSLSPEARTALQTLIQSSGRIPWAAFARRFGEIREMGAGRRDREQPHLHPASISEVLFYRALLWRAFFETEKGPQEFAYVPEDLLQQLPSEGARAAPSPAPLGRAARQAERAHLIRANERLLDDATTFLAALRIGHPVNDDPVLRNLLESCGILHDGVPQAARVKDFLEMQRPDALRMLADTWRASSMFNELRLLPGLICEGPWKNDPLAARGFILDQLRLIPAGAWWNLPALINGFKQEHADFQRPAGDYESWFIKNAEDGSYLRGFSSWDQVDGALVRFVIAGVMHRLGLVDLAAASEETAPAAFRFSPVHPAGAEDEKVHVGSQGRIAASSRVPRLVRYQLARFCEWEAGKEDEFRYRITPRSLEGAAKQGLKVEHLVALLAKHADAGIPPALVRALKRWEANGPEARVEAQTVLKVRKPEILQELRKSRASKYLGEPLGPTTVIVKSGAIRKVAEAMAELGLLLEETTGSSG